MAISGTMTISSTVLPVVLMAAQVPPMGFALPGQVTAVVTPPARAILKPSSLGLMASMART